MTIAGKKTAIYKGIKAVCAALIVMGYLPEDAAQIIINNLEASIAAYLAIDAVVGTAIRHFTEGMPFWRKQ